MNHVVMNIFLSVRINLIVIKFNGVLNLLRQNVTYCLLLLFTLNSFAQPPLQKTTKQPPIFQPPVPQPPIEFKLTVLESRSCTGNKNDECLLVKRLDNKKTETVRIKNFNFDKDYTYTLLVKEINESIYKYVWVNTLKKIPVKPPTPPETTYKITIEADAFSNNDSYVEYRKEGEENVTSFPKDHFIGLDFTKKVRYILKVKEVVKNDQTYLQLTEQVEPKKPSFQKMMIITIEPFEDYHNIKYSYIKNGVETQEILDDTFIVGMNLQKSIRYKLKVENIGTDFIKFKLVEQIEPKIDDNKKTPEPGKTVLPYTCEGEEKHIATSNEIIYTDYILAPDGNVRIKHIDIDEPLKIFTGQIFGFTFTEDHKYTLEVKPSGGNYILIDILCDSTTNIVSKPDIKKYTDYKNNNPEVNPPKIDSIDSNKKNKQKEEIEEKPLPKPKPKPLIKITLIDDGIWYLRYLFQADALTPINELEDTSFTITFKTWKKVCAIKTPCGDFEANCITDDVGLFNFENLNGFSSRCDETTKLLIEQLKTVKKYTLIGNVLKLSLNDKVLIQLEGFPK